MVEAATIEPNMTVWIFTSPETRKVGEIRRDNRATMSFCDNREEGYVTMIGHARLVEDRDKKKSLWKFEYAAFFPNGSEGNGSVLIEFTPQRIEIMHFHLKVGIWPWKFKPATLIREEDSWVSL
jgi:general stress protein 26